MKDEKKVKDVIESINKSVVKTEVSTDKFPTQPLPVETMESFISAELQTFLVEYTMLVQRSGYFISSFTSQNVVKALENKEMVNIHLHEITSSCLLQDNEEISKA